MIFNNFWAIIMRRGSYDILMIPKQVESTLRLPRPTQSLPTIFSLDSQLVVRDHIDKFRKIQCHPWIAEVSDGDISLEGAPAEINWCNFQVIRVLGTNQSGDLFGLEPLWIGFGWIRGFSMGWLF